MESGVIDKLLYANQRVIDSQEVIWQGKNRFFFSCADKDPPNHLQFSSLSALSLLRSENEFVTPQYSTITSLNLNVALSFQILINNSLLNADSALLHTNIADEQVSY